MKRMSKTQSIGAAAAISALALTGGLASVAHAATAPAPQGASATVDTPTAGDKTDSKVDTPTAGDTTDSTTGDVATAGDTTDSTTGDVATAGDMTDSKADAADHEKTDSPDTDNVQQGDQSGPDTSDGASSK